MFYDITKFILCHFILEIHLFLCHYKFNFMSQNLKITFYVMNYI